jgi:hypothetical protein
VKEVSNNQMDQLRGCVVLDQPDSEFFNVFPKESRASRVRAPSYV